MKKIISCLVLLVLSVGNVVYAENIAIIGGGASGLVSAWLLEQDHHITLYEADNRLGGHANSIDVMIDNKPVSVEAGVEFFNEPFYPHLFKLLRYLKIPLKPFTLVTTFYRTDDTDIIMLPPYHDIKFENKSFTPRNLSRAIQLKMIIDKESKLIAANDGTESLQQFMNGTKVSKDFKASFLYPLLSAGWGVTPDEIQDFSSAFTLKYLVEGSKIKNYQWYEVDGGLKKYIEVVRDSLHNTEVRLNARVTQVTKENGHYLVSAQDGSMREYDQVIFATDANVTTKLISTMPATVALATVLGKVKYYDTKIAIHGDKRFMPKNPADWRVVNIRYDGKHTSTTMYKAWKSKTPIFKSWVTYDVRAPGDKGSAMPENLYALITYKHPVTDVNYLAAQAAVKEIQGDDGLWYAGMWTVGSDSHESTINSAINIATRLAPNSERLKLLQ